MLYVKGEEGGINRGTIKHDFRAFLAEKGKKYQKNPSQWGFGRVGQKSQKTGSGRQKKAPRDPPEGVPRGVQEG